MHTYIERMEAALAAAASCCGQSDVLFESRLQSAFEYILADAPDELKPQVEAELRARGYDPDFEDFEPGEGECGLTGIAIDCCPCGRHE
ncbi:hypothetical protein [Rubrivivax gelatinosus]|uniref:hypothetical protein n=1 Tax=Rubrivivax gelatinosus TaxID=28068 RepID=UPI0002F6CEBE|nr:hypothetical protein [Rubrivivax gelatinosus]MBG6083178.1 hypothetical protein [Rubrivivax gelatinosus]